MTCSERGVCRREFRSLSMMTYGDYPCSSCQEKRHPMTNPHFIETFMTSKLNSFVLFSTNKILITR